MATAPSPRGFGKDKSARSGRRTGARQCLAIAGSGRTAADRSTWVSCRAGGRFGLRRGLGNGEKAAPRAALASFPPGPKRRGAGGASPGPVARRREPQGEGGAARSTQVDRAGVIPAAGGTGVDREGRRYGRSYDAGSLLPDRRQGRGKGASALLAGACGRARTGAKASVRAARRRGGALGQRSEACRVPPARPAARSASRRSSQSGSISGTEESRSSV